MGDAKTDAANDAATPVDGSAPTQEADTGIQLQPVDNAGSDVESQTSSTSIPLDNLSWWRRQQARRKKRQRLIAEWKLCYRRTETRKVDEAPPGYPRFATLMSSDHAFSMFRSFRYLHVRLLLNLQDEIVRLENRLSNLDKDEHRGVQSGRVTRPGLISRRWDVKQSEGKDEMLSRPKLLRELEGKMRVYGGDDLLLKTKEVTTMQRPSKADYHSVRNFVGNEQPLVEGEQQFVEHWDDLVTFRSGRQYATFDEIMARSVPAMPRWVASRLFSNEELRARSSEKVFYHSTERIAMLSSIVIGAVVVGLLIAPAVTMYKIADFSGANPRTTWLRGIGVLIAFTMLFGVLLSMLTMANRHEVFAASAAYAAVLATFIGNSPGLG